jgi:hypothetical protein
MHACASRTSVDRSTLNRALILFSSNVPLDRPRFSTAPLYCRESSLETCVLQLPHCGLRLHAPMNTICACAGNLSISFPWWVEDTGRRIGGRDILVHNALHRRGVLLQRGLTGIDILCGDALLSELNHRMGKVSG